MSDDTPTDTSIHEPTEEQKRGARRTAFFFFGLVVLLSLLTLLARILGW